MHLNLFHDRRFKGAKHRITCLLTFLLLCNIVELPAQENEQEQDSTIRSTQAHPTLVVAVNKAFATNAEIERRQIDVDVRNDTVVLRGKVDNYYEMRRAEDIALQVKGVHEVVNKLTVGAKTNFPFYYPYGLHSNYPSPYVYPDNYYSHPVTDDELKENIEDQLWWSPLVDEANVKVLVNAGKVILQGTVENHKERKAAIENAYEGGARIVVDQLDLERNND